MVKSPLPPRSCDASESDEEDDAQAAEEEKRHTTETILNLLDSYISAEASKINEDGSVGADGLNTDEPEALMERLADYIQDHYGMRFTGGLPAALVGEFIKRMQAAVRVRERFSSRFKHRMTDGGAREDMQENNTGPEAAESSAPPADGAGVPSADEAAGGHKGILSKWEASRQCAAMLEEGLDFKIKSVSKLAPELAAEWRERKQVGKKLNDRFTDFLKAKNMARYNVPADDPQEEQEQDEGGAEGWGLKMRRPSVSESGIAQMPKHRVSRVDWMRSPGDEIAPLMPAAIRRLQLPASELPRLELPPLDIVGTFEHASASPVSTSRSQPQVNLSPSRPERGDAPSPITSWGAIGSRSFNHTARTSPTAHDALNLAAPGGGAACRGAQSFCNGQGPAPRFVGREMLMLDLQERYRMRHSILPSDIDPSTGRLRESLLSDSLRDPGLGPSRYSLPGTLPTTRYASPLGQRGCAESHLPGTTSPRHPACPSPQPSHELSPKRKQISFRERSLNGGPSWGNQASLPLGPAAAPSSCTALPPLVSPGKSQSTNPLPCLPSPARGLCRLAGSSFRPHSPSSNF